MSKSFQGGDSTVAYFDANAKQYTAEHKSSLPFHIAMTYAQFALAMPKGGSVLDVGCGFGLYAECFAHIPVHPMGLEVIGIDGAGNMIKKAKQRRRLLPPSDRSRLLYEQVRYESLPERGDFYGRFDGIWAFNTFINVPLDKHPLMALCILNMLKPGGIAFLTWVRPHEDYGVTEPTEWIRQNGILETVQTDDGMIEAFDQSGVGYEILSGKAAIGHGLIDGTNQIGTLTLRCTPE